MSTPPIIIIAEPDHMISSALRVEFDRGGFVPLLAATGQEAEDFASQTMAHLVVLDTRLHLGAYDACVRIRRRRGYETTPIVLTTHESSPRVNAVAHKAGATLVLPKPYSVSDLFTAIQPFVAADDLLLTHRAQAGGFGAPQQWWPTPPPTWQSGADSALTRNGQLLPIVRGKGAKIPLVRPS